MFSKTVALITLLVAAVQGSTSYGADYSSFSYGVNDPYTGDIKGQQETRLGNSVVGQYSLLDSDGTRRTVDYAADALNGFNAVVRKDPAVLAAPIARAAPLAYTAPIAYKTLATPLAYSRYSSPLAYAGGVYGGYAAAAPLGLASPYGFSKYY